ncbi:MAG: hypothetical protein Q7S37_03320 [bacterium]|nr:hypothetical protein [bacterium]
MRVNRPRRIFRPNIRKILVDERDIRQVSGYLKNPTNSGIWIFKGDWSRHEGFSGFLENQLKKEDNKINSKQTNIEEIINQLILSPAAILSLFYLLADQSIKIRYDEFLLSELSSVVRFIGLTKIKKQYNEAIDYFKEHINYEDFNPLIRDENFIKIKSGMIIPLDKPTPRAYEHSYRNDKDRKISFTSINAKPLEELNNFFLLLGQVKNTSILPIYSPKEEVFSPYVYFLESVTSHICDPREFSHVEKMSSEYKDGQYSASISSAGLLAEEYLIQIFETLFRDPCPEMPLGNIYNLIYNKVINSMGNKQPETKKINREELSMDLNNPETIVDLDLVRKIFQLFNIQTSRINTKINELSGKEKRTYLFPSQIAKNIDELIIYRNNVSHKSRMQIDDYEAIRSIYCLVSLMLWWKEEKNKIDWKKNNLEIIKEIIERNK